ncbi:helix-turn-helix domain-containing protein, partial [archaeon]|nr:helix-turn-helix domain-containing protein [archaeon]
MNIGDVEAQLHGTTLKVYWYLVRVGEPVGVRRLQRALGLSSPSVAAYHLSKLVEMGLVEKDRHGDYRLKEVVQVGALRSFVRISGLMLPRFIFYAAYFATLLAI